MVFKRGKSDLLVILSVSFLKKSLKIRNELKAAGVHEAVFDANHLPSGVYLYRITASDPSTSSGQSSVRGFAATRKMLLVQ